MSSRACAALFRYAGYALAVIGVTQYSSFKRRQAAATSNPPAEKATGAGPKDGDETQPLQADADEKADRA